MSQRINPLSEENKFNKLKESCDDVLIVRPSGAGKGYLAKLLQTESNSRAGKNFIHINSAAISSTIFESEMFGHTKGSFTGAFQNREGYCSKVKDGDLFLDEIGDMSLELQAKLLVLINDRTYTPLGSCEMQKFYGRIIAATNKNLRIEVINGKFREDLYYRLSNFVLNVKALCEQKDKIPELVKTFLMEENSDMIFDKSALECLANQKWNGNIRQLKNVIKRIIRYDSDKNVITREDVIPYIEEENDLDCKKDMDFEEMAKAIFHKIDGKLPVLTNFFVNYSLKLNNQKISVAAKNIGMGRKTLERMVKRHRILECENV